MSAAVLAGASVDGSLRDATLAVDAATLVPALVLFALSLTLASWLRRRQRAGARRAAATAPPPG
jgi:hypothetical protein